MALDITIATAEGYKTIPICDIRNIIGSTDGTNSTELTVCLANPDEPDDILRIDGQWSTLKTHWCVQDVIQSIIAATRKDERKRIARAQLAVYDGHLPPAD